jgi:phosphohistidine phosphatase SixA
MVLTTLIRVAATLSVLLTASIPLWAQEAELLSALQSPGHVGLMRHSTAPGSDDPPNFRLGDCATQRNLSSGGRVQAAAIGDRLRTAGISNARVVSSQWCRCMDTSRLLAIGTIEELPSLNSLISYPGQSGAMTRSVTSWILEQELSGPTILVTHQVNIGTLIGVYPEEGDIVVVQRTGEGTLRVVGTIAAGTR